MKQHVRNVRKKLFKLLNREMTFKSNLCACAPAVGVNDCKQSQMHWMNEKKKRNTHTRTHIQHLIPLEI